MLLLRRRLEPDVVNVGIAIWCVVMYFRNVALVPRWMARVGPNVNNSHYLARVWQWVVPHLIRRKLANVGQAKHLMRMDIRTQQHRQWQVVLPQSWWVESLQLYCSTSCGNHRLHGNQNRIAILSLFIASYTSQSCVLSSHAATCAWYCSVHDIACGAVHAMVGVSRLHASQLFESSTFFCANAIDRSRTYSTFESIQHIEQWCVWILTL